MLPYVVGNFPAQPHPLIVQHGRNGVPTEVEYNYIVNIVVLGALSDRLLRCVRAIDLVPQLSKPSRQFAQKDKALGKTLIVVFLQIMLPKFCIRQVIKLRVRSLVVRKQHSGHVKSPMGLMPSARETSLRVSMGVAGGVVVSQRISA